jgi:hypothetical protein
MMPGFPQRHFLGGPTGPSIGPTDLEGSLAWRADFVGGPG